METKIEKIEKLKRKVSFDVPLLESQNSYQSKLRNIAKNSKTPGFRPGKTPLKIIEKQYGPQVKSEVLDSVIKKSYIDYIKQNELDVIGYPQIKIKNVDFLKNLQFEAVFEIYPEITINNIEKLEFEDYEVSIDEKAIDEGQKILLNQHATYENVERLSISDDLVTIDYEGKLDGEVFEGGKGNDVEIHLGNGKFLPDFEANLTGLKTGDKKEFDVKFPDDYQNSNLAGKNTTFKVSLKSVKKQILPKLDQLFFDKFGIKEGGLKKFRQEIKDNLQKEAKRKSDLMLKNQVLEKILDISELDLPEILINDEIQRLESEMKKNFEKRGMEKDKIDLPKETFEIEAKKRVKLGLIMADIVKKNDLKPTKVEIQTIIKDRASSYKNPEEIVNWYYKDESRLQQIESVMIEDNFAKWVTKKAIINTKKMSYDELMKEKRK